MSIQSEINRLNAAKAELKTSIENGGVTVSLDAKIDAYPALVDAITQQVKDKVDAINGEVVEGDVDAKLNKITSTKTDLAAALAEKGQTVGDVFSTYGDAVRAIETGSSFESREIEVAPDTSGDIYWFSPKDGYSTAYISPITNPNITIECVVGTMVVWISVSDGNYITLSNTETIFSGFTRGNDQKLNVFKVV